MNKIGIMQGRLLPKDIKRYQVFPSDTWEEEFGVCKRSGFSAIELLFDIDAYYDNPLMYSSGQEKIVKLSKSSNISVSSVCADFFKKYGFFQNSQQVKESNIFVLRKLVEACGSIGCGVLLIPFLEETEIRNKKDKEDIVRTVDLMDKLLEKYGVDICLETTLCSEEITEFMEKIDRPHVKVYYDIGNGAYFKYNPSEEILRLSKWIGGIHIKDRDEKGCNVVLGTGLVDFAACFESIKKIGYKGSYILETTMCDDPVATATKNLEFVKTFI